MVTAVKRDGSTVRSVHNFDSQRQAEGFVGDFNQFRPYELCAELVPPEFEDAEVVVLTLSRQHVPERLIALASYFVRCGCGRAVRSNGPVAGCPTCAALMSVAV